MDQVRDTYNMVHACQIANEAEKDNAIQRASGFNELFEAFLRKECEQEEGQLGPGSGPADEPGSGSKGKGKKQFGPEVEHIKKLMKDLVKEGHEQAAQKWTWGVDLTDEDLRHLIWGANSQSDVPHSGYDQDLSTGSLRCVTSEALDSANLDDWNNKNLLFDELSTPINEVPELCTPEIERYSFILLGPSGDPIAESEPDPVIDDSVKSARTKKKLLMQDEVNKPVGYLDYETDFHPQRALIPCQPWLTPHLPIILSPSTIVRGATERAKTSKSVGTDSDTDPTFPDHIIMSESEDHPMIQDSASPLSQILFPVSDSESSDPMDVVRSNEQSAQQQGADTDGNNSESDSSIPDHINLPYDFPGSDDTRPSLAGFRRDPSTGRFTPASFANVPDDLVD